jgi:hypothetical protein
MKLPRASRSTGTIVGSVAPAGESSPSRFASSANVIAGAVASAPNARIKNGRVTSWLTIGATDTRGPNRKNKSSRTGIAMIQGCSFTTPNPADRLSTTPVARGTGPRVEVDSLTDGFYQIWTVPR